MAWTLVLIPNSIISAVCAFVTATSNGWLYLGCVFFNPASSYLCTESRIYKWLAVEVLTSTSFCCCSWKQWNLTTPWSDWWLERNASYSPPAWMENWDFSHLCRFQTELCKSKTSSPKQNTWEIEIVLERFLRLALKTYSTSKIFRIASITHGLLGHPLSRWCSPWNARVFQGSPGVMANLGRFRRRRGGRHLLRHGASGQGRLPAVAHGGDGLAIWRRRVSGP